MERVPENGEPAPSPEAVELIVENPTVYSADKFPHALFKIAIFLEVTGKILVFLSCFPPWGSIWVSKEQKSLVLLGGVVVLTLINAYYLLYIGYVRDEIPFKRQFLRCPFHLVNYLAFFNLCSKAIISNFFFNRRHVPQLFDKFTSHFGFEFHNVRPFFLIGLMLIDIAIVAIGACYSLQKYKPLKLNRKYTQVVVERRDGPNLSILESKAFSIVLRNETESILEKDKLTITRKITRITRGWLCGLCRVEKTTVSFTIPTPEINPGSIITIIPEMHSQEGAIRVPNFRAFGYDVGESIVTTVKKGKETVAKLTEEYKKRRESDAQGAEMGEVCPNWSRTARNPNYMRTLM